MQQFLQENVLLNPLLLINETLIIFNHDLFPYRLFSPTCYILPLARSCATNSQVKANCEHIWTAMWVLVVRYTKSSWKALLFPKTLFETPGSRELHFIKKKTMYNINCDFLKGFFFWYIYD